MSLELSDHVRRQAARRGIDEAVVRADGSETAVTVYRTSKIAKYWRTT